MSNSLLMYAYELIAAPPVELFDHQQNIWAKALPAYKDGFGYNNLKKKLGQEFLDFYISAVCDLIAESMMVIAVGFDRVEAMKKAAREGAKKTGQLSDYKGGNQIRDRVYRFADPKQGDTFDQVMKDWSKAEGVGVAQFKFDVNGNDWHTFVIERYRNRYEKQPLFRVYQAYQNTCRLRDFMVGKKAKDEQEAHLTKIFKGNHNGSESGLDTFLAESTSRIETTANLIGKGNELTRANLYQHVIKPLVEMLKGKTKNSNFVDLTSSGTEGDVHVSIMGVLVCDGASPASYGKNYATLHKPPKTVTRSVPFVPDDD